jgi:hypothetical protein
MTFRSAHELAQAPVHQLCLGFGTRVLLVLRHGEGAQFERVGL